ncbi:MAG TPA: hypothetical protein V6D15_12605 [Oculatellaceae cyanobacterium]|jgi:zinc transporter ZupT
MLFYLTFLCAVALAIVHLYSGKLRFLKSIPRSHWLSLASGASVAYVFVHIFPELRKAQTTVEQVEIEILKFLEHHVYLMGLLGFTVFYGLERLAKTSRQLNREAGEGDATTASVFWLHIISFALYNIVVGYLLIHREETTIISLLFFFIAMALHFMVNDYGLQEHHKASYKNIGRWILAAAIIIGWAIGTATEISEQAIALLFAFLAGGVILNVLKEELPQEHQSRFWAFAVGAAVYAAFLLTL